MSNIHSLMETLAEFSEVEKKDNNIKNRVMHQYADNIFAMKIQTVFCLVCKQESKILNRRYL